MVIGAGLLFAFAMSLMIMSKAMGGDSVGSGGPRVGVVDIKGAIGTGKGSVESETVMKTIRRFAEDKSIKAVVVRIDSPGGAVAPSQEIYGELKKLANKKKVVCSMGSTAASGGYYVALGCPTIYAEPGTLTGSIGVVSQFPNVKGIAEKFLFKMETVKSGKLKDMGNPFREMTPEERVFWQELVSDVFEQFLDAVAESRHIPKAELLKIADGRVLTGSQALRLKLVDKMGSLNDAAEEAVKQAGEKGEPDLVYPPETGSRLLEELLGGMTQTAIQTTIAEVKREAISAERPGFYYLAQ